MSNSDLIVVAPEALTWLESQLRGLPVQWDTAIMTDFSGSGEVASAYSELMSHWDKARANISDSVDRVANVIKSVREAFESVDSQMAAGITPVNAAAAK